MASATKPRRLFGMALGAGVLLGACLDPTQVTLDIRTDAPCASPAGAIGELVAVGVVAGSKRHVSSGDTKLDATSTACDAGDIGTVVLYPEDGAKQASALVIGLLAVDGGTSTLGDCRRFATGELEEAPECVIARRQVTFIDHRPLRLPVTLYAACAGVRCSENTTCVPGAPPDATGQPCVSSEVRCEETGECEEPTPQGGGGVGGAGGGDGAGGAGGGSVSSSSSGGGGSAGVAELVVLELPANNTSAIARGVSEDGLVVVGAAPASGQTAAMVWRDGAVSALIAGLPSMAVEACGDGSTIVGTGSGDTVLTRWAYQPALMDYFATGEMVANGVEVDDCDDTGQFAWVRRDAAAALVDLASVGVYDSVPGEPGGFAAGGSRAAVLTAIGSQVHPLSPPTIGQAATPLGGVEILGLTADGAYGIGSNDGGYAVFYWSSSNTTAVLAAQPPNYPRAIAGTEADYVGVGSCGSLPRVACVWTPQGAYSVDGVGLPQWSGSTGADTAQLASYDDAVDISADGKVIVGNGRDADGNHRAWKLVRP